MDDASILREVDEVVNSPVSLEAKKLRLFGLAEDPTTLRLLAEALLIKAHVQAHLLDRNRASNGDEPEVGS